MSVQKKLWSGSGVWSKRNCGVEWCGENFLEELWCGVVCGRNECAPLHQCVKFGGNWYSPSRVIANLKLTFSRTLEGTYRAQNQ